MNLCIAGSTGSIGTQTLDVVRFLNKSSLKNIKVSVLMANMDVTLMENQAREFCPEFVVMADERAALSLASSLSDTDIRVLSGEAGIEEAIKSSNAGMMLTAFVGISGLKPTLYAMQSGMDIAIANKETLVCAGEIIMDLALKEKIKVFPVDSEHYAIWQCILSSDYECRCGDEGGILQADFLKYVDKVFITASGGAFRGKKTHQLCDVTAADALKHPNWSMGRKITIDSATLINKAFEVIEAHHLFNLPYDIMEVLIHPQSIIHSMVQYVDGSVIAQLAPADMRIPIQGVLSFPHKVKMEIPKIDFTKMSCLNFYEPDFDTFPLLEFGIQCGIEGGSSTVALNAANEVFVNKFLNGQISFTAMQQRIIDIVAKNKFTKPLSLDEIIKFDMEIREECMRID